MSPHSPTHTGRRTSTRRQAWHRRARALVAVLGLAGSVAACAADADVAAAESGSLAPGEEGSSVTEEARGGYWVGSRLIVTDPAPLRVEPRYAANSLVTLPRGTLIFTDREGVTNGRVHVRVSGRSGWVWTEWVRQKRDDQLRWGLHPRASDVLRTVGITYGQITQTIGSASASAGTHGVDGVYGGLQYSAAVDISVRGMSEATIRSLLERMGTKGYAAFYRKPGYDGWPSYEAPHIHAVYAGCAMKSSLDVQIRDYLVQRDGLYYHTYYDFYRWSDAAKDMVGTLFRHYN